MRSSSSILVSELFENSCLLLLIGDGLGTFVVKFFLFSEVFELVLQEIDVSGRKYSVLRSVHSLNLVNFIGALVNSNLSNATPAIWDNALYLMASWSDDSVHLIAHLLVMVNRGAYFVGGELFILFSVDCFWNVLGFFGLISVEDLYFGTLSLGFHLRFDGVEVFERFEPSLEKDVFLVEPSNSLLFILNFELEKHFLVIQESLFSLLIDLDFLLIQILVHSLELLLKQLFDHWVLMADSLVSVGAMFLVLSEFILHCPHHRLKLSVEFVFELRVLFGLVVFIENPIELLIGKMELLLISNILGHELHHETKLLQALLSHGFDDFSLGDELLILLFFRLDLLLKRQIFLFVLFLLALQGIDFLVPLLNEHEGFHDSVDFTSGSLNIALNHPLIIPFGMFAEVHRVTEENLDFLLHHFLFIGHYLFESLVELLDKLFI